MQLKTKIQGPVAVIGDLHGQAEKLAIILDRLRKQPDFQERWILFIGDFVDRGPDSKGTIDMVLKLIQEHPRTSAIMGNHEFAMCSALGWLPENEEKNWGDRWLDHYDSHPTIESYGAAEEDLADLALKVPTEHRELLVNLPWCVEHSQLLFVHAGLDPNLPFDTQLRILRQKDFTLVRPQWLCEHTFVTMDPPEDCPFTVVSGHVKVNSVVIRPRRILIDTTGGDSGELSCVLMPERAVITSSRTEKKPTILSEPGTWNWLKFWG